MLETFMGKSISGIQVPQEWIDEIGSVGKEDRRKKAVEITAHFVR